MGECEQAPGGERYIRYTPDVIEIIDDFIDEAIKTVNALDLKVDVIEDFSSLSRHLRSKNAIVNPTFNPNEHDIEHGFWLRVTNRDEEIVACHAERIFRSIDFVRDVIETGRLWWRKPQVKSDHWHAPISILSQKISGNVAYAGSMLISENYRRIGLSLYLPYLSRALCMKKFRTDFHAGIVRERLSKSKVPSERYGFPNMEKLFRGTLPGVTGPEEDVYLCWMNYRDAIKSLIQAPNHPTFPIR